MNDAPRDDLQAEDFRMTAHLLRELQVLRQRGNEDALFAVVRHRSGELVGLNELSWSRSQPTHVSQGSTCVKPAHRLGQWLKAANIVKLLEVNPVARLIRATGVQTLPHTKRVAGKHANHPDAAGQFRRQGGKLGSCRRRCWP